MKCVNCGKELIEGSSFCDGCGAPVGQAPVEPVNPVVQQETSPIQNIENNIEPNNNNKKSSNKIIIIIIVAVLLIGIILAIVLLIGNGGKNSNNSENNNNSENVENAENGNTENGNTENGNTENGNSGNNNGKNGNKTNIVNKNETTEEKYKRVISNLESSINCNLEQNKCLLTVKNNTDEYGRIYATNINFKDENGDFIGSANGPIYISIDSQSEGYGVFMKPYLIDNSQNYSNYEIEYVVQSLNYGNYKDDISYELLSKYDENKQFIFKVKNNSDEIVDILDLGMKFYRDGKLVAIEINGMLEDLNGDSIEYMKPHEECRFTMYYPQEEYSRSPLIVYDNYEVFVDEAYSYKDARDLRYRNSHLRKD